MIMIVCKKCGVAIRTSGDSEQIENLFGERSQWYPDKFPCPNAFCGGYGEFTNAIEPEALKCLTIYDLAAEEAFAAFSGLGVPEERDCGPVAIEKAFAKPIKKINSKIVPGSNRSVIYWIEFEDNTRMFFGASSYGAIVYRIAQRESPMEPTNG